MKKMFVFAAVFAGLIIFSMTGRSAFQQESWTALYSDPDQKAQWSIRGFQAIDPGDIFSFELRTDYADGHGILLNEGGPEGARTELLQVMSCKSKVVATTAAALFDKSGNLIIAHNLSDNPRVEVVVDDTVNSLVWHFVCSKLPRTVNI